MGRVLADSNHPHAEDKSIGAEPNGDYYRPGKEGNRLPAFDTEAFTK